MGVGNSSSYFMLAITQLKFGLCMFDLQSSLLKFFVKLIIKPFLIYFMYQICLIIFSMLNIRFRLLLMNFFTRIFKLFPSFMSIRFCKMTSLSFVHIVYVLIILHFLSLFIVLQICSLHFILFLILCVALPSSW